MDYTKTDNKGYDILVGCGDKIINGLSEEPNALVVTLRAVEFVTDEIMEEILELQATRTSKARKLYTSIKATVKQYPHKYEDFIAMLEKNTLLYGDLLRELKETMEKTSSSSTNLASPRQSANWKLDLNKTIAVIFTVLAVLLAVVLFGWLYYNWESLTHNAKLSRRSKTLPYLSKSFVGREKEMRELMSAVEFATSCDKRIVNIIGSPGFGKSTLAIHVGHRFVDQGVHVHYVDLRDFQEGNIEQILTEKILKSAGKSVKRINFERLLEWARDREEDNLIILDNCDDILQKQKSTFQRAVDALVKSSQFHVKVVMTSREVVVHLDDFKQYKIHELSLGASVQLLDKKVDHQVLTHTESEQLANLTGHVPLALHVIGSLLNLAIDPPSPSTIIEELKKHPMVVLSPSELPETQQVNASISLSYKYLTDEQRTTACFLAFFPGSFTLDTLSAVVNEYNGQPSIAVDKKALKELLYLSLLEYDDRAKRYQYHSLVRQFFVEQHKHRGESGISATKNFTVGFQYHFSKELYRYTTEFKTKYVDAVQFLDTERHNIQYLLESIIQYPPHSRHSFLITVDAVVRTIQSDFLTCRFTPLDLSNFLQRVVSYLDKNVERFQERRGSNTIYDVSGTYFTHKELYFRVYTSLVISYGKIVADVEGKESALAVLLDRVNRVESLSEQSKNDGDKTVSNMHGTINLARNPDTLVVSSKSQLQSFYMNLGNHHLALGQHSEVVQCQMKIQNKHCSNHCSYKSVGYMYMNIDKKEEAAMNFELSMEHENNPTFDKAEMLLYLLFVYHNSSPRNAEMMELTFNRLLDECNEMIKTSSELFYNRDTVLLTVSVLRQWDREAQADILEERLFNILFTNTSNTEFQLQPKDALELLKVVENSKKHTKTIIWGSLLLEPFQHYESNFSIEEQCSILKIRMVISIAQIYSVSQFFAGLTEMEGIYTTIMSLENKLNDERSVACFYLIPRVIYISQCYRGNIGNLIVIHLYEIVYAVFVVPFDMEPFMAPADDVRLKYHQAAVITGEQNSFQVVQDICLAITEKARDLVHNTLSTWLENPKAFILNFVYNNLIFRLLVNISSIWIRLYVFFTIFFTSIAYMLIVVLIFADKVIAPRYSKTITDFKCSTVRLYCAFVLGEVTTTLTNNLLRMLTNHFGYHWKTLYIATRYSIAHVPGTLHVYRKHMLVIVLIQILMHLLPRMVQLPIYTIIGKLPDTFVFEYFQSIGGTFLDTFIICSSFAIIIKNFI